MGVISIPQGYQSAFPASPGRIALLWSLATVIGIANTVCFPGEEGRSVLSTLYFGGTSIFAGLVAGWVLELRRSSLHLMSAMGMLDVALGLSALFLKIALGPAWDDPIDGVLVLTFLVGMVLLIELGFRRASSGLRRGGASMAAILVAVGSSALLTLDVSFWRLSAQVRPLIGRGDPEEKVVRAPAIDADVLWGAQHGLVGRQVAALRPRKMGEVNVYAMAIAGSGTQALFGREARAALRTAAAHFDTASRGGVLLSNAAIDQMRAPLATRDNIAATAAALGVNADRVNDLLFIYLASHGSRAAELSSELSDYQSIQPISSASMAQALSDTAIERRIIVVSACFAATWIPALANDNTIVITAAARNRTSFGCDDSRDLTVFGEGFLGSLRSPDISLHDAFEDAKRKISALEMKQKVRPSLPQAFVGRNMNDLWHRNDR